MNQFYSANSLGDRLTTALLMRPNPCPYPMIRIGGENDGAYLIPLDLENISACFSPGVNIRKDFEDELVFSYRIPCHMCDFNSSPETLETPLIPGYQTLLKKWLSPSPGPNAISIDQWVNEYDHNQASDLLLQMDIEGAEYENLLACSDETLRRFRIIVIELHDLDEAFKSPKYENMFKPLLQRLSRWFTCVHAHPNNCCGEFVLYGTSMKIPNFIELTYLRNDRFIPSSISSLHNPCLPHPLDVTCVPENPPIFLEGEWLAGNRRGTESEIAILKSQILFLNFCIKNQQNRQLALDAKISNCDSKLQLLYSLLNIAKVFKSLMGKLRKGMVKVFIFKHKIMDDKVKL